MDHGLGTMSMSKRRKKGRKNGQHDAHVRRYRIQMCRNYSAYEKKRRGEGNKIVTRIKKLKEMIPAVLEGASKDETSALLCVLDMVFRNHSYRVHVTYMELHPGTVNAYGLKRIPSKSSLHNMAKALSGRIEQLAGLLLAQAGDDARGTVIGDSSGFSIMNYVDWEDAKKGLVSRREFDKLHVLVAPHGMISACEVTYGRKHDSPVFCDMYGRIPHGDTGGHVLLDAAYLSRKNCRIIADSGREPVICPKKNSVPRGFNPMGKMLRWHRDDPCGFAKAYGQRSLVENTFSVMKERFGAVARARTASMRRLQLVLKCICYNLVA